jgi:hypothetical protein
MLKTLLTGFIWLMYAGLVFSVFALGAMPDSRLGDGPVILALILFTLLAGYVSRMIWRGEGAAAHSADQTGSLDMKSKRGDVQRIGRLIEQLDGDEMIELETLLSVREYDQRS